MAVYLVTGWEFLLLLVIMTNLEIIHQLLPFIRLDGYWALADLTGLPDFFSQMGAFWRSILPVPAWKGQKLPELRWWGKAVFVVYTLVTVPLLAFLLFLMIKAVPRVLATARDSFLKQMATFAQAQNGGDVLGMVAALGQALRLLLPTAGLLFTLYHLAGCTASDSTDATPTGSGPGGPGIARNATGTPLAGEGAGSLTPISGMGGPAEATTGTPFARGGPASGVPAAGVTAVSGTVASAAGNRGAAPTITTAVDVGRAGGGPSNVVNVNNNKDGRFDARGSIDLNRINQPEVAPVNRAVAQSSCTDCQSISVAVQIVLYKRGSRVVAPQNEAVALNQNCTRCVTVARAIQYVIPVDDPNQVPKDVDELIKAMDRELRYFEQVKSVGELDPAEAEARLNRIIAQFQEIQQYLQDLRRESTAANTAPTAAASGTPGATGTPAVPGTPAGAATPAAAATTVR